MATPQLGRILVVDDEVELMLALCEMLTDQGYEAIGQVSPSAALACLQTQDIDLLLCDLMMPEMDGIALLRAALDIDPHLVGIIMTGQGTIQTAVDAMKVGAFDYLLKPFRLQTLLPVLARALQVRQLRMENVQLREAVAIYELGQAMAYTLDTKTLLYKIVDVAMQQVNGEEATVMLPTADGEELFVAAVRGEGREALLGTRVSIAHSITGWVARHREPLTLHGPVSDARFVWQPGRDDITAIALPMLAGGKLVGVLSVNTTQRQRAFTLGQVKALSILANLAATALENASLYMQVRQSEERFRSVTESAADAIISADSNGTMLSWNRSAQALFGYTPEEAVGRSLQMLLPERYRQICANGLTHVTATGQQRRRTTTIETHGLTRDGREVPVELALSNWQTPQGVFFSAVIRDIRERKQAEEALRQAQKMQAIGTLAGGIAHDFNNILTAILGYTELAMQEVPQDSMVWCHLQGVFIAGYRARDLVQQILAFSRHTVLERAPIQLHSLVKEALLLLRAAIPSTIALQQAIDVNAGVVLADPTQIYQVLINLCTNAAHAMRDTGGVLEVRLEPIEVTDAVSPQPPDLAPGAYVKLMVRDTGHGIDPENLERIFEPFFTTKPPGEGTGMGLAVVHGVVVGHHGTITVESAPGQGTTFTVYLPRSERAGAAEVSAEAPPVTGHGRILFVDDEDAIVQLGKAVLERLGYEVVVCTSSTAALETFRATPQCFDLVITDRTMPRMTGEALIHEIRSIRPDMPIILCTGFSQVMTVEQARRLGINAFLLKPMMTPDWARVIQQVLTQRAAPGA